MSERLTASDFLQTLQIKQLTSLFTQSLIHHNVTALYAVSDEIKRRDKGEILYELVEYAFHDGCEFKYNSAIAEALKLVMEDLKKVHPLCLLLWSHLDDNESNNKLMTEKVYQKLLEEKTDYYFDKFCDSMTPLDLAHISGSVFNTLVTHYIDLDEELEVKPKNSKEEESIRWYKGAQRFAIQVRPQI